MRIAKYPPIAGVGVDMHGKMPPLYLPPVPPLPPSPAPVPKSPWAVIIAAPVGAKITGKWSLDSVATEGLGDILWGYDWGILQVHIPILPPYLTPSIALLLTSSSVKYWLPSFMVQEKVDGAALAKAAGGGCAVAISTPAFLIPTQDCQDSNCLVSFVAPTSICFQHISVRWVGFNAGDFIAGLIGMVGDGLSAAILSYFGGSLMKGVFDNMLLGAVANTALGAVISIFPWSALGSAGAGVAGFVRWMLAPSSGPGSMRGYPLMGAAAGVVSWGFGLLATGVGNTFGSGAGTAPSSGGPAGGGGAQAPQQVPPVSDPAQNSSPAPGNQGGGASVPTPEPNQSTPEPNQNTPGNQSGG